MRFFHRFFTRLHNLATRRRGDARLREEMESHLAHQAEEYLRAGMSPTEARRQARVKFGAVETVRENYRAEEGLPFIENLLLDVRYALRVLRKSPAFTVVALATLMLGIGANVVVFGVLNEVLLHPLEVHDPQSLYQVRHKQWMVGRLLTTSYPTFEDLRRRNTTFSGMAGMYGYSNAKLNWRNSVRKVSGYEVTGNYFDMLGVQPEAGHFFHEADEHGPNSAPYVVLSNALWRSTFHADPGIVGTVVELDKHPFTVVGVTSAQFHGTEKFRWPDYWVPMMNEQQLENSDYLHNRTSIYITVLGRLKPGVTQQQATENLNAVTAELAKEYPETDDGQPLRLIHPGLIGDEGDVIRGFLYSVSLLALLVLAAACANLATLFAARAADRSRELALRVALGSSRRRLVRQLLTEALVVSLIGGAAGLGSAYLLLGVLNRSSLFVGSLTVSVDVRVYLVGLVLTLGSTLLFGLVPARQAWQSSPMLAMKGGQTESTHLHRFTLRDLLLGVQIAICMLLVTASFVAVRGMIQALHTPLGIKPEGAMLAYLDLSPVEQANDAVPENVAIQDATLEKQKVVLEAVRSIPGVTAVGMVNQTPMTGGLHGIPIFSPGTTEFKLKNSVLAPYVFSMSPGYLGTAGTRLLRGRDVSWHDTANTPYVAVVNETCAQKMWDRAPAIGQRFMLKGKLTEVVGVAEDGKYHDLTESPQPVVYLPLSQSEDGGAVFVVRSQRTPKEMAAALEHTLSNIAPNVPISVLSWSDQLAGELFPARAATVALGAMGLLAAMLAVTGIFGMAAYNVSRRKKELGIRMALGARKTQVMSAAVGRPMGLLSIGSVLGLLAGISASRLLGEIVYHANPKDPAVVGGAVLTMALLGIAASAIPARRALAVDPSKLMREE
ncbi:ABC transporter permease [Terriglobus saanensis]|uniref:Permease n=1 Tax=Terriglobus saanensis (strain ATCC BAA-1853 / DSM 23119 / SP1PR4) TaxID=401053 RepID=E8V0W8_TERSS|nr:ABC transporter permease [Terriglobus saanensis]ADV82259.1 permease [Terriglobus saanensis SP1PR4]